nr:hypothetical protein [Tanacetum cinerariifolium]
MVSESLKKGEDVNGRSYQQQNVLAVVLTVRDNLSQVKKKMGSFESAMNILYTPETKVKKMMLSPFDKSGCVLRCMNTKMVPLRKMRQRVLGNRVVKLHNILEILLDLNRSIC